MPARLSEAAAARFAPRVIDWQRRHGRHDLPWQSTRDPYRVWLSEIMLQQTQVSTVLDYYPRFLARFPDLASLAQAQLEQVLGLWSGLGYYTRARNLHRCAQQLVAEHGGQFPRSAQQLQALPGIGRSTAAAIAAFCFGERAAILDGNVKRVLTRVFGIDDDVGQAAGERALWQLAERLLQQVDARRAMPRYTQGLMDLGATVCTRSRPDCAACPLQDGCVAARSGAPERYPAKRQRAPRSQVTLWLLHATDGCGRVWLQQRPASGIWARLHCLPQYASGDALLRDVPEAARAQAIERAPFTHVLTHRELAIHVVEVRVANSFGAARAGAWHAPDAWPALGLPAPVRRVLEAAAQP